MKLKYQQGGTLPSYVVYQPTQASAQQTTEKQKTENESNNKLDDALYKLLASVDALPGDLDKVSSELSFLFKRINDNNSYFYSGDMARDYLHIIQKINLLKFNKDTFEKAREQSIKSGSINEPVIDSLGRVMVISDKSFKWISPEELSNNSDKYNIVTNAELLNYRAQGQGGLAFNDSVINTISNGVGISDVTKYIQDTINNLGSISKEESGYIGITQGELLQGLKDYEKALKASGKYNASVQDLYKIKLLTEDQIIQAQQALSYIYNTLPETHKTLLKVKSNGNENGAKNLIGLLINSKLKYKNDFDVTLDNQVNSDNKKKSNVSKLEVEMTPVAALLADYGQHDTFNIQTSASKNIGLKVPVTRMPITTKEGKSVGNEATLAEITESSFAGALNMDHATMGGAQILGMGGASNIIVDGTALFKAILPVDLDAYSKGLIKPDFSLLEKFRNALQIIKEKNLNGLDKKEQTKQINEILKSQKLPIMYTEEGKMIPTFYKSFGILNGVAFEQAFAENVAFEDYLFETFDKNEIENALRVINKKRGERAPLEYDERSLIDKYFTGDYTNVYKGTIFIPMSEDFFTATAGSGQYTNSEEAKMIEARQQQNTVVNNYVRPKPL